MALTFARGLSFGSRALVLLLLARVAPPSAISNAAIAVTLADTARLVFDLGVEVWLVRAIGSAPNIEQASDSADAGLVLRLISAALAAAAVWTIARFVSDVGIRFALAGALLTATGLFSGVPIAVMQARFELIRLRFSLIPILLFGVIAVAAASHFVSDAATLLLALGGFESIAICAALVQCRLAPIRRIRSTKARLLSGMRECIPVALYNGLVGGYTRLDVWLLAFFNIAALPTYTVAYRMYQPAGLCLAAIGGVAYASMTRAVRGDARTKIGVSHRMLVAAGTCTVFLVVGFIALSTGAVSYLFPQYPQAVYASIPLALLLPITGYNGICVAMLFAQGRLYALCRLAGFNCLAFAAILIELIPAYGATGAAAGMLCGELVSMVVLTSLVRSSFVVARPVSAS